MRHAKIIKKRVPDRSAITSANKAKGKHITVCGLLFVDDAALVALSAQDLQTLLNQFL